MNDATRGTGGPGDGTRAVRAGLPEPVKHEPTLPGPVFAAHFHLPGDPTGPYTYGRDENPTWTLLERAIGELEGPGRDGVETLVFASGMAAISAVLFSQLRAGDAVVLPDDGYQALPLARAQLEAYGIEVRTAPTGGDAQLEVLDGAKLLWIETPSNPGLDVCDVRRLADALRERPEVTGLRYPGLPDDPSHKVASLQMRRYGCVVSFTLPSRERADSFLDALRLVDDATSFGGVRSTAERRGRWGGDAVPEGFVRFSVGAEDPEDLIADVLRALDVTAG